MITQLTVDASNTRFGLFNAAEESRITLDAGNVLSSSKWNHFAFTYEANNNRLTLYANGRKADSESLKLKKLPAGKESYLTLGRDSHWDHPLPGIIDELRISRGLVYMGDFEVPGSFAPPVPDVALGKGTPLRFGPESPKKGTLNLWGSKHVFWDSSIFESSKGIAFNTHQPNSLPGWLKGCWDRFVNT